MHVQVHDAGRGEAGGRVVVPTLDEPPIPGLTPEPTQQLVTEYEAGASIKKLAAHAGLHPTTVAPRLGQADIQLRRQGVPDTLLVEARCRCTDGWSSQRLAERYGRDAQTVRQTLNRAGVRLRAPWER